MSTMIYSFTFRRVRASDVSVSPDQIPFLSRPVRVGAPGFTFIRDKRDNPWRRPAETTRRSTQRSLRVSLVPKRTSASAAAELDLPGVRQEQGGGKRYVFARSTRIGIENPFSNTIIVEPGQEAPSCPPTLPREWNAKPSFPCQRDSSQEAATLIAVSG